MIRTKSRSAHPPLEPTPVCNSTLTSTMNANMNRSRASIMNDTSTKNSDLYGGNTLMSSKNSVSVTPMASAAITNVARHVEEDYNKMLDTVSMPNYKTIKTLLSSSYNSSDTYDKHNNSTPSEIIPGIQVSFELFETVQNRFALTRQNLERTKAELLNRNSQYTALQTQLEALNDEFNRLTKRNKNLESAHTDLQQVVAKQEVTLEVLRKENSTIKSDALLFQEKLMSKEEENQLLQNKITEGMVLIAQKDAAINTLRRELGRFGRFTHRRRPPQRHAGATSKNAAATATTTTITNLSNGNNNDTATSHASQEHSSQLTSNNKHHPRPRPRLQRGTKKEDKTPHEPQKQSSSTWKQGAGQDGINKEKKDESDECHREEEEEYEENQDESNNDEYGDDEEEYMFNDDDDNNNNNVYTAEALEGIAAAVEERSLEARMKMKIADLERSVNSLEREKQLICNQHTNYRSYVERVMEAATEECLTLHDEMRHHVCVTTPYLLSSTFYTKLQAVTGEYVHEQQRNASSLYDMSVDQVNKEEKKESSVSELLPDKFDTLTTYIGHLLQRMRSIDIDSSSVMCTGLNDSVLAYSKVMNVCEQLSSLFRTFEMQLLKRANSIQEMKEEWNKAHIPFFITQVKNELGLSITVLHKSLSELLKRENEYRESFKSSPGLQPSLTGADANMIKIESSGNKDSIVVHNVNEVAASSQLMTTNTNPATTPFSNSTEQALPISSSSTVSSREVELIKSQQKYEEEEEQERQRGSELVQTPHNTNNADTNHDINSNNNNDQTDNYRKVTTTSTAVQTNDVNEEDRKKVTEMNSNNVVNDMANTNFLHIVDGKLMDRYGSNINLCDTCSSALLYHLQQTEKEEGVLDKRESEKMSYIEELEQLSKEHPELPETESRINALIAEKNKIEAMENKAFQLDVELDDKYNHVLLTSCPFCHHKWDVYRYVDTTTDNGNSNDDIYVAKLHDNMNSDAMKGSVDEMLEGTDELHAKEERARSDISNNDYGDIKKSAVNQNRKTKLESNEEERQSVTQLTHDEKWKESTLPYIMENESAKHNISEKKYVTDATINNKVVDDMNDKETNEYQSENTNSREITSSLSNSHRAELSAREMNAKTKKKLKKKHSERSNKSSSPAQTPLSSSLSSLSVSKKKLNLSASTASHEKLEVAKAHSNESKQDASHRISKHHRSHRSGRVSSSSSLSLSLETSSASLSNEALSSSTRHRYTNKSNNAHVKESEEREIAVNANVISESDADNDNNNNDRLMSNKTSKEKDQLAQHDINADALHATESKEILHNSEDVVQRDLEKISQKLHIPHYEDHENVASQTEIMMNNQQEQQLYNSMQDNSANVIGNNTSTYALTPHETLAEQIKELQQKLCKKEHELSQLQQKTLCQVNTPIDVSKQRTMSIATQTSDSDFVISGQLLLSQLPDNDQINTLVDLPKNTITSQANIASKSAFEVEDSAEKESPSSRKEVLAAKKAINNTEYYNVNDRNVLVTKSSIVNNKKVGGSVANKENILSESKGKDNIKSNDKNAQVNRSSRNVMPNSSRSKMEVNTNKCSSLKKEEKHVQVNAVNNGNTQSNATATKLESINTSKTQEKIKIAEAMQSDSIAQNSGKLPTMSNKMMKQTEQYKNRALELNVSQFHSLYKHGRKLQRQGEWEKRREEEECEEEQQLSQSEQSQSARESSHRYPVEQSQNNKMQKRSYDKLFSKTHIPLHVHSIQLNQLLNAQLPKIDYRVSSAEMRSAATYNTISASFYPRLAPLNQNASSNFPVELWADLQENTQEPQYNKLLNQKHDERSRERKYDNLDVNTDNDSETQKKINHAHYLETSSTLNLPFNEYKLSEEAAKTLSELEYQRQKEREQMLTDTCNMQKIMQQTKWHEHQMVAKHIAAQRAIRMAHTLPLYDRNMNTSRNNYCSTKSLTMHSDEGENSVDNENHKPSAYESSHTPQNAYTSERKEKEYQSASSSNMRDTSDNINMNWLVHYNESELFDLYKITRPIPALRRWSKNESNLTSLNLREWNHDKRETEIIRPNHYLYFKVLQPPPSITAPLVNKVGMSRKLREQYGVMFDPQCVSATWRSNNLSQRATYTTHRPLTIGELLLHQRWKQQEKRRRLTLLKAKRDPYYTPAKNTNTINYIRRVQMMRKQHKLHQHPYYDNHQKQQQQQQREIERLQPNQMLIGKKLNTK